MLRFKVLFVLVEAVKISDFCGLIVLSIAQIHNSPIGLSLAWLLAGLSKKNADSIFQLIGILHYYPKIITHYLS